VNAGASPDPERPRGDAPGGSRPRRLGPLNNPRVPAGRPPVTPILLAGAAIAPWLAIAFGLSAASGAALASLPALTALILWWKERGTEARARTAAEQALAALARDAGTEPLPGADPQRLAAAVRALLEERQAGQAALRAVLNAIDAPVLALDGAGTVVLANRSAELALGRGGAARIDGQPFDQLLPDEHALAVIRGASHHGASRGQTRLLTPRGPRTLEIGAEPISPAGARPGDPALVVTLRDVTEQANAMQLKTDFVANASHELRTPLASIKTAAETLAELGDESPPTRARLVSMIAGNAARLEELSRDLLDLSSLESADGRSVVERIDVLEMAGDIRDLFETACSRRRIALEFDLDQRLRAVWTDSRLLRLVLRNLIDNAVKFAYEDTTVQVRGSVSPGERGGRAGARFEVVDRGIGIPLAQQQRIFERFFQVDGARTGSHGRRGTGLGLAIVKHALRAIGGSIRVDSVWQQGTTMTVELPGCVEAEPVSA